MYLARRTKDTRLPDKRPLIKGQVGASLGSSLRVVVWRLRMDEAIVVVPAPPASRGMMARDRPGEG